MPAEVIGSRNKKGRQYSTVARDGTPEPEEAVAHLQPFDLPLGPIPRVSGAMDASYTLAPWSRHTMLMAAAVAQWVGWSLTTRHFMAGGPSH